MSKNLIALQNRLLGSHNSAYDLLSERFEQNGYIKKGSLSITQGLVTESGLEPALSISPFIFDSQYFILVVEK